MRKYYCFILLLLFGFQLFSQTVRNPVKAPYTRTNTYSHFVVDVFSFSSNTAALAQVKNITAGVYGERRFMLGDLGLYQLNVAVPTSAGSFGLNAIRFGGSVYNETALGLAYARKLGEKIDVGVQFNYYNFKVSTYGNASSINAEAGLIFHATDQLNLGAHIYNPTATSIGKNDEEKLPAIYSLGFGWDASKKFFIGVEISKEEDQPVNLNGGMQYGFDEKLFARAGFSSASSQFYFGAGVLLKDFRIDVTATFHPQLGITPGLMLIYNSKK